VGGLRHTDAIRHLVTFEMRPHMLEKFGHLVARGGSASRVFGCNRFLSARKVFVRLLHPPFEFLVFMGVETQRNEHRATNYRHRLH
jgi:hypothetical protein